MASPPKAEQAGRRCDVEGCDSPHVARGFCKRHYRRFKLYGDPEAGRSLAELHARATEDAKVCSRCDCLLPLEMFAPDSRGFMGRASACRPCWNAYCRDRLQQPEVKERRRAADAQPDRRQRVRLATLRRKFGDRGVELEEARLDGSGRCAGCGSSENLGIDHCHVSGAARGLLCRRCNLALGYVEDDPERLAALIRYLG